MTAEQIKKIAGAVIVFLLIMSSSLYFLMEVRNGIHQEQQKEAYDLAKSYTEIIEAETLKAGKEAAAFAGNAQFKGTPSKWFPKEAQAMMDEHPAIVGMELAQFGKKDIITSYPENFSVAKEAGIVEVCKNIKENTNDGDSEPRMVAPVELADGSTGAVCVVPIFLFNAKDVKFNQWGSLTVVYKLPDLISEANITSIPEKNYIYRLYGNNPLLTDDGEILTSVAEMPAETESSSAIVPQGLWLLKVAPDGGFGYGIPTVGAVVISAVLGILGGVATIKVTGKNNN